MEKFYYDLHMHSCLSPCAENEMTPAMVAGMAALNGLHIAALTDHNSAGNLPAFFEACRAYGVVPVAGMELETAESVHLVCLFPTLEAATACWQTVKREHMMPVKNKPAIFGEQLYMNADDEVIGIEETLLITSTALPLADGAQLVRSHGGVVFPAHIDRAANGILEILGDIPPEPGFTAAEFNDAANIAPYRERFASVAPLRLLVNSDAHRLSAVQNGEGSNFLLLDAAHGDEEAVRRALFARIGG